MAGAASTNAGPDHYALFGRSSAILGRGSIRRSVVRRGRLNGRAVLPEQAMAMPERSTSGCRDDDQ